MLVKQSQKAGLKSSLKTEIRVFNYYFECSLKDTLTFSYGNPPGPVLFDQGCTAQYIGKAVCKSVILSKENGSEVGAWVHFRLCLDQV